MFKLLRDGTAIRIFITVLVVYAMHFASDVVRESYLALSLVERHSIRVDDYLGLHPDLFEVPGRGAFINNNPGASMLAAVPYAFARPAIDELLRLKPELAQPKPPATYNDPRPNRNKFFNAVRARGLDIKLGLAAASMQVGLMAPLGALAAVAVFGFLLRRVGDRRKATWLALLYAFGTPIFFRSAFLNQNVLTAHFILFAYIIIANRQAPDDAAPHLGAWSLRAVGFLLGMCLLCDYSGTPLVVAFGVWLMLQGWRAGRLRGLLTWTGHFTAGAALPLAALLAYQWAAFGNPLLPAQVYMPATEYSVRGWHGFFWPAPELLWRNLLDLRYGLFAFCPMLMAALAAPFLKWRPGGPARSQLWLIFGASAALYIFISSVQFAFLQWNTGVRYIVPAVPLLFFALVPVLLRMPRGWVYTIIIPTVAISWSVSMTREAVPTALTYVFLRGFQLPWLNVLQKTASGGYLPFLQNGASPIALFVLVGIAFWAMWGSERRSDAAPSVVVERPRTRQGVFH